MTSPPLPCEINESAYSAPLAPVQKRLKFADSFVCVVASNSNTASAAYVASMSAAFLVGSLLSNPSNRTVMSEGMSKWGAPGAVGCVDGAEVVVGATGGAVLILPELVDELPLQAVRRRAAVRTVVVTAVAVGRVVRDTRDNPRSGHGH
jgi:hypothetical protein